LDVAPGAYYIAGSPRRCSPAGEVVLNESVPVQPWEDGAGSRYGPISGGSGIWMAMAHYYSICDAAFLFSFGIQRDLRYT
jgi:hypothetical protein